MTKIKDKINKYLEILRFSFLMMDCYILSSNDNYATRGAHWSHALRLWLRQNGKPHGYSISHIAIFN